MQVLTRGFAMFGVFAALSQSNPSRLFGVGPSRLDLDDLGRALAGSLEDLERVSVGGPG
jgi:hypothetical protein